MPANTRPKHIVVATIGSLGDLHPCMALALELMRRGHRVTIASTGYYREKVEALMRLAPVSLSQRFNGKLSSVN